MTGSAQVELVLGWPALTVEDEDQPRTLRRNSTGFSDIQNLVLKAQPEKPLQINAFFYAFLCPAKNFDLILVEDIDGIKGDIADIKARLKKLEAFERDGSEFGNAKLKQLYLAVRKVAARANARDEQRTMALLLLSGASTAAQIAAELGISENLAKRVCQALGPIVEGLPEGPYSLKNDTDALAVAVYLVRATLGLDPMAVLDRLMRTASRGEGG